MDTFKLARVSLTLLRAFEAAARHLSFTRAAAELGRTQATLSVQVRELERVLDVRLLDRTTRRVSLTDAGVELAEGLRIGFDAITAGLTATRKFADSRRRRIVVGCVPSLSGVRLPVLLAGYRQRDSNAEIDIEELTYVEMVEAIQENRIDFGIGPCSDPPPSSITFSPSVSDPLCILLPATSPHAHDGTAPLSLLTSMPLIFLNRSAPLNRSLREVAKTQGITFNAQTKVRHVHTAIGMVRAGLGAAIVPRLALPDVVETDLVALPIDEEPLTRKIGILTFRGRRLQPTTSKLARHVSGALAKSLS